MSGWLLFFSCYCRLVDRLRHWEANSDDRTAAPCSAVENRDTNLRTVLRMEPIGTYWAELFRFAYQASRITFECSTLLSSIQFDKAIGFEARALDLDHRR